MRKLSHDEIAKTRLSGIGSAAHERFPLYVLAHNIRSLYNVGSIFRTSDAVPITRLLLTGYTPTPPRREIEKTALGATKSVPWEYIRDPVKAIENLRASGVTIYCLEQTDQSIPYTDVRRSDFPLCLVIGNELTGVPADIVRLCSGAIEIPMFGIKHSLNVAVAYGVAVFELFRCWREDGIQKSNDRV